MAEQEYQKAIECNQKEPMAHNNLAIIYMKKKKSKEAEQEFKKENEINPLYSDAYFNLGIFYYQQGNTDGAEKALRKAVEVNPEHINALKYLTALYFEQKNMAQFAVYMDELQKRGISAPSSDILKNLRGK